MFVSGKVTGCLCIRFKEMRSFRPEDLALTRALSHQAQLALQLIRLSRQSRQAAVDAERNRMARDIHDTLAQSFTGVILQLEAARGALEQGDLSGVRERIERAGNLARVGLGEARRSVLALRPQSLDDSGLHSALQDLLKRMTSGSALLAEVHLFGEEPPLPAEWKAELLRIAQESLTNTIKHANARIFKATLAFIQSETHLDLLDDGSGFDPGAEIAGIGGFGLKGMRERIDQLGGTFTLNSAPGRGTEISIILRNTPESTSGE
jgi:signal transduction histidine kinase